MANVMIKIKDLTRKVSKKENHKPDAQVATITVLHSEPNKFTSLIALATAARGCDAEDYFPRLFQQDTEDAKVTHVYRPACLDTEPCSAQVQQNTVIIPSEMTSVGMQLEGNTAVDSNTIATEGTIEVIEDEEATVEPALITSLPLVLPSFPVEHIATDDKTVILSPMLRITQQEVVTPAKNAVEVTVPSAAVPSPACEEIIVPLDLQITSLEKKVASSVLSIRDFTVIRKLGSGGFGTVHLVRHNPSGTSAALKVINKRSHASATASGSVTMGGCDTFGNLTEEIERGFETMMRWGSTVMELFALQRIAGTPGMLEILGSFHDSENFYYVTPFYPGGDLQSLLIKKVHFKPSEAKFYLAQLLVAIEALHKMGIIHRDLKPANLFIDARGYLVVGDFGLAKTFDKYACEFEKKFDPRYDPSGKIMDEDTISGCGTPAFMAPELWMGGLYSYPVDIWAFAVIAYCLILGESPWDKEDLSGLALARQIKYGQVQFTKCERIIHDVSEDAEMLILRGMEKDQDLRPTASRLKAFAFFKDVDWEGLANGTLEAPWVPDVPDYQPSRRTEKKPAIKHGKLYSPSKDQIPFFAYTSPHLGSHSPIIPSPTTTLCDFSSSPQASCDDMPPAPAGYPLRWSPTSASGIRSGDKDIPRGSLRSISIHCPSPLAGTVGLGFYVDREDSGSLPFLPRMSTPSTEPTALVPEDVDDEWSHFSHGQDTFRAVNATTGSPVAAEPSFTFMVEPEDSQSLPFILRNVNTHQFNNAVYTTVEVVEEVTADVSPALQSPMVYNETSHTIFDAEQEALRFLSAVRAYRKPTPFAIAINKAVAVVEEVENVDSEMSGTPTDPVSGHSQPEVSSSALSIYTSVVSTPSPFGVIVLDILTPELVSSATPSPSESVEALSVNGVNEPLLSTSRESLTKFLASLSVCVVSLAELPTPSPSSSFSLSSASSVNDISFGSSVQSISPSGSQSPNLAISTATFNIPCTDLIYAAPLVAENRGLAVAVNLLTQVKTWVRNFWDRLTCL